MTEQSGGYEQPILESYTLDTEDIQTGVTRSLERAAQPMQIRLTIRGQNLIERAMMPLIRIGKIWVTKYEIMPDGTGIICYLDEMPEEDAIISINYGTGTPARLSETFSRSRLQGEKQPNEEGRNDG